MIAGDSARKTIMQRNNRNETVMEWNNRNGTMKWIMLDYLLLS